MRVCVREKAHYYVKTCHYTHCALDKPQTSTQARAHTRLRSSHARASHTHARTQAHRDADGAVGESEPAGSCHPDFSKEEEYRGRDRSWGGKACLGIDSEE